MVRGDHRFENSGVIDIAGMTGAGTPRGAVVADIPRDVSHRATGWALLAVAGFVASLLPVLYLHLSAGAAVNPVRHTVSDYALVPGGAGLLALSVFALAAGSAALVTALTTAGLPRPGRMRWLLGSWCVGLAVAGVFRTDPADVPSSLSGNLHRYAGLVMFLSVPLAGAVISRRCRESARWNGWAGALRGLSVVCGIASAVFLVAHVPVVLGDLPVFAWARGIVLLGLAERVLFAAIYLLLFAVAAAVLGTARRAVHQAGERR
jgi:hypothetical protein